MIIVALNDYAISGIVHTALSAVTETVFGGNPWMALPHLGTTCLVSQFSIHYIQVLKALP